LPRSACGGPIFDLAGAAATRTLVERGGHRSTLLHDIRAYGHWPLTLGLAATGGRLGRRDPGRQSADRHLWYSLAVVRRGGALPGRRAGWCDGRPGGRGRGWPGQATPGHAHHRSPRGRIVAAGRWAQNSTRSIARRDPSGVIHSTPSIRLLFRGLSFRRQPPDDCSSLNARGGGSLGRGCRQTGFGPTCPPRRARSRRFPARGCMDRVAAGTGHNLSGWRPPV
jgi:hypothetical protein